MRAHGAQRKDIMAFKVNYNQQRAERDRAKQAKKEAKQREKEEETARRKAERENPSGAHSAGAELPPGSDHPEDQADGAS
jgi:hypothetical protein